MAAVFEKRSSLYSASWRNEPAHRNIYRRNFKRSCGAALQYAQKNHVVMVLKDARTVTATEKRGCFLNLSGNDGMATAGSGDVLSGVIGALLAQGHAAGRCGTYVYIFMVWQVMRQQRNLADTA